MADLTDNLEKGMTLMQEALKKYADGDIKAGDKNREFANEFLDKYSDEMNTEEGQMNGLYGESRNFGIIYNVFEQNIDNIYQEDKKHIIKETFDLIKNNPLLNEQFKIYDMFEKTKGVENAKEFVNEASDLIKHHDRNTIKKTNEKLIRLIRKNKLNEYVEIPEETENLYEAIEYVILNKKNFNNVSDFIKAQNIIAEHIEKNSKNTIEEQGETFKDFKDKVDEQENEINESMNEDEKKLLDMFTNPNTNKRTIFENCKKETLKKIKDVMQTSEEADKDAWKNIYESVNSKNYSKKLSENIVNCAEMLEICSTIEE